MKKLKKEVVKSLTQWNLLNRLRRIKVEVRC